MKKSELIKKKDIADNHGLKEKLYKRLIILVLILLITLFLAIGAYLFMQTASVEVTKEVEKRSITTLPEESFIFKTIKGQTFKIDATKKSFKIPKMQNRIVFLKVFGWNCKYCEKEIPELINLKMQFDGAFDVIAIESQNHTTEENLKFVEEKNINYHIVTGDKYKRFLQYLKDHHNWNGLIPLSIVIGEDGSILAFEVGSKSYTLAELLKVSLQQYKMIQKMQDNR